MFINYETKIVLENKWVVSTCICIFFFDGEINCLGLTHAQQSELKLIYNSNSSVNVWNLGMMEFIKK